MAKAEERQVRIEFEDFPEGRVARVVISNARRLNSVNSALADEFADEMAQLTESPDLRALVLTGEGDEAFVGGADIQEMQGLTDSAGARRFIERIHGCCAAIRAIPVPTMARVQGYCFGAGLEMAAACDLRVACETAVFGMPEVRLGIPSVAEAALLPMLVGWGRARHMLLLGENIDARQALEWRLVEQVAPPDRLDEAVRGWALQILSCGPEAVRLQKALIRDWEDLPLRAAIAAGLDAFAKAYDTDEPQKMMGEFLAAQAARKRQGG